MSSWWEWYPDVTWQHDVNRIVCVPTAEPDGAFPLFDQNYGDIIDQDLKPPQKSVTLKGHGLDATEIAALENAIQSRGQYFSATDYQGVTHSGTILSLAYTGLQALNLFDATIQLRI